MNSPIHYEDNTNDEREDSQNKRVNAVPSESDSPPAPANKKYSGKKCRKCLDIARFVVETLALIGLVVYACLTYLMYCETKKAANAAKSAADTAHDTLIASQRPWVAIAHDSLRMDHMTLFPDRENPPSYTLESAALMTLENFGNGPALRVTPPMIHIYLVQNTPPDWEQNACTLVEAFSEKGDATDVVTYYIMPRSTVPTQTQETQGLGQIDTANIHTYWVSVCFVYRDSLSKSVHHTKILLYGGFPFDPKQRLNVREAKVD